MNREKNKGALWLIRQGCRDRVEDSWFPWCKAGVEG